MEQWQQVQEYGKDTIKDLQVVLHKIGRFEGRNITKFLKIYVCKMKVHQVLAVKMISTFDLPIILEIRKRVKELHEDSIS